MGGALSINSCYSARFHKILQEQMKQILVWKKPGNNDFPGFLHVFELRLTLAELRGAAGGLETVLH